MKDLTHWYIAMISVYTDLVTMWTSKASMRLYLSIMSYSVCFYLI
jgi:succinate-acetate transporter protein